MLGTYEKPRRNRQEALSERRTSVVSLKFVEQFAKWGGPRTAADAPRGLLFVNRSQSRTRGIRRGRGRPPHVKLCGGFQGHNTSGTRGIALPAGRGSATPSKDQHSPQSRPSM